MVCVVLRASNFEPSSYHCDHCPGAQALCSCPKKCARGANAGCLARHDVPCSSCCRSVIVGTRFNCMQCDRLSLCKACVNSHDATHSFFAVTMPGERPRQVGPNPVHEQTPLLTSSHGHPETSLPKPNHDVTSCDQQRWQSPHSLPRKGANAQQSSLQPPSTSPLYPPLPLPPSPPPLSAPEPLDSAPPVTIPATKAIPPQPFSGTAATTVCPLESVAPNEEIILPEAACDICTKLIKGLCFHCTSCEDYDLCEQCYRTNLHDMTHAFEVITSLASDLSKHQILRPRNHTVKGSTDLASPSKAHCAHCPGWLAACVCTKCTRTADVKCVPPQAYARCKICSKGEYDFITGDLFRCGNCSNVSLCMSCYEKSAHQTSHPFVCWRTSQLLVESLRPRDMGGKPIPRPEADSCEAGSDPSVCSVCKSMCIGTRFRCTTCSPTDGCLDPTGTIGESDNVVNLCNQCFHSGMHTFSPEHNFVRYETILGVCIEDWAAPRDTHHKPVVENFKIVRHQNLSADTKHELSSPAQSSSDSLYKPSNDEQQQQLTFTEVDTVEEVHTSQSDDVKHIEKIPLEKATKPHVPLGTDKHEDRLSLESSKRSQTANDTKGAPAHGVGNNGDEHDAMMNLLLAKLGHEPDVMTAIKPLAEPSEQNVAYENVSPAHSDKFENVHVYTDLKNGTIQFVDTMHPCSIPGLSPNVQNQHSGLVHTSTGSTAPSGLDYMESVNVECAKAFCSQLQKAGTCNKLDSVIFTKPTQPLPAPSVSTLAPPKLSPQTSPSYPASPGQTLQATASHSPVLEAEASASSPFSQKSSHSSVIILPGARLDLGPAKDLDTPKTEPHGISSTFNCPSPSLTPPPPPPPEHEDCAHESHDLTPSAPSICSSVPPSSSSDAFQRQSTPRPVLQPPPPPPPEDLEDLEASEDLTPSAPPAVIDEKDNLSGTPIPPPPPPPVDTSTYSYDDPNANGPVYFPPKYQPYAHDHLQQQHQQQQQEPKYSQLQYQQQQVPHQQYSQQQYPQEGYLQQHPQQQHYQQQQQQHQHSPYQHLYQYQYPGGGYENAPAYAWHGAPTVGTSATPTAVQKASEVAQQAIKEASSVLSSLMKKAKK